MNTTRKTGTRAVEIQWLEDSGRLPVVFFRQKAVGVRIRHRAPRFSLRSFRRGRPVRHGSAGGRSSASVSRCRGFGGCRSALAASSRSGFTLLELLIVVGIIGFMASLALPHLRGFTKANSMTVATRQLLDDIALARQRAIANHATVYMVFVPAQPWFLPSASSSQVVNSTSKQMLNIINKQYRGYALIAARTVGDQPGQPHPQYLTDWRTLPNGVFIATYQFASNQPSVTVSATNMLASTGTTPSYNNFQVTNFYYTPTTIPLPFPSILDTPVTSLPVIAFGPNSTLLTPTVDGYQYVALTSGSVFCPAQNDGTPVETAPLVSESPAGEWTNNPNLIRIDATTARATLERNRL